MAAAARSSLAGEVRVLAPGNPKRAVQFTDARDLAAWTVRALDPAREGGTLTGTYTRWDRGGRRAWRMF